MTIMRMDHVGIVFKDLPAAVAFFVELGMTVLGTHGVDGEEWVDRVNALDGVRAELAMLETPDGRSRLELVTYHAPTGPDVDQRAPVNAPGMRHLCFLVDDIDAVIARLEPHGAELVGTIGQYEDIYRLCYLRGPEGIIVELSQEVG
jgi:catechol 2,3-dioxygenase-like lactoylglutathione lyase family enzyme